MLTWSSPGQERADDIAGLVERAQGGDRDSFGELVERFWPEMVALARTILAGHPDSEDVVQESFVVAWRRLGSLREARSFPAWVRRIVGRRCLRHARRWKRETELSEIVPVPPPDVARLDVPRLLARLTARQRAVLYLTEVEGRTAAEAAALLGILPATARVHRFRALGHLRRLLETDDE